MNEKITKYYYLGDEFPDIYFTQREIDCLLRLLEGHTIMSAGEALDLSPRTVEFYLKNMRMKMGIKTKVALLKKIRSMDFIERLSLKNIENNCPDIFKDLLLDNEIEDS